MARHRALALLLALLLATGRCPGSEAATAQSVGDVLLGMLDAYAGPIIKAASDMLTNGLREADNAGGIRLPQCRRTDVLLDAGGFPGRRWANLAATQQAQHPINLVAMTLAYMVYRPLHEVNECLSGMGMDPSSMVFIAKPVPEFATTRYAYVFKAGGERVFVLLRGSSETDIGINIACRQAAPGDEAFGGGAGGEAIQVHTGFWAAWRALEPDVLGAVNALLKKVRGRGRQRQARSGILHRGGACAGAAPAAATPTSTPHTLITPPPPPPPTGAQQGSVHHRPLPWGRHGRDRRAAPAAAAARGRGRRVAVCGAARGQPRVCGGLQRSADAAHAAGLQLRRFCCARARCVAELLDGLDEPGRRHCALAVRARRPQPAHVPGGRQRPDGVQGVCGRV
jgi:hypothetical protein